jgi:hypothetical protein
MTDAAQETKQTRKRRPKGQSMPVMKELIGLMDQRTAILVQIRQKKMELAQLEASMRALADEIQWRANIFGMVQKDPNDTQMHIDPPASPPAQWPSAPPVLTQPIFVQSAAPEPARTFNRGSANADLASLS